ncbi:hypothetical protein BRARA_F02013 [Brassica rapa]|uniref:Serine aminopeptidase S33 domain-containing protein n=4 Tax=Brassica TaxID=3705 RepID=A0ABQ7X3Y0_BRANA|nr:uncharacterized protein LOC106347675 isoform X1 [Brassica napus]KAG5393372.1 hypothetical protein IGI04_023335 [Brassica rapa subsp. trilocularis]KAH0849823.1 hypothetical protein HID58_096061 [Brassica napus]RID58736.1 hypothetical protein BRARA_F02013 [Brassica rapa]CAG7870091.1 unnamed protein product [Brassica rapa]
MADQPPNPQNRIKLRDGRYLAYKERGIPKDDAKFTIVLVHGFGSSKDMNFNVSQEFVEETGIYFVLYDRAGYGESDPNPKRSLKSEASDVQELADGLQIGSRFYLIGISMGSYTVWSCLKHIPQRLAGVAMVAPVVNYRWPSIPKSLMKNDYRREVLKWSFWIAKYFPGLLHWWVTQNMFPTTSMLEKTPANYFNDQDIEVLKHTKGFPMLSKERLREHGVFETLRSDFLVAFADWDFDPADLPDPFPSAREKSPSSVHIWQGYEDKVIPFQLQRCLCHKLAWIKYHEVSKGGHLIVHYEGVCDAILKSLLLGEDLPMYKPKAVVTEP